jgi:hypothetical protein
MRGLAITTYVASLRADGTIERTSLTPAQQALLRKQAETLETSAASLQAYRVSERGSAAEETITVARERDLALWCDDAALRQTARARGIATFSLLDLVTVLGRRGVLLDQRAILRRLAEQYVVDLPLTADDIIAVAMSHDWSVGPAHTALGRAGWWRHHDSDWADAWLEIATTARSHSSEALVEITKAALTGAIDHVPAGFGTQRYQQVAVLALVGCYQAGSPPPPDLLDLLARHALSGLPPRAPFVLKALIQELARRSVADADVLARRLLPDVDLP